MEDADKLYALYLKHFILARSGFVLTEDSVKGPSESRGTPVTRHIEHGLEDRLAMALGVRDGKAAGAMPDARSTVLNAIQAALAP
ncbi:hypothetical protein HMI51_03340 [Corallococcus coralloides]|nr:hypothetical protein [Corallococcus coralloides]